MDGEQAGKTEQGRIIIKADQELEDLIPGYLEHRRADVALLAAALERGDYEAIRVIGHQMRGSGGGYGFDALTGIGSALELAAKGADRQAVDAAIASIEDFLERLEVVYE